ncbi:hypothetical protein TNCV_1092731, partial [Trichonephila clavipes]
NTENLYLLRQNHLEIENEVRELTSEILTAHGRNASKPVTHSEVPFVQGILPEVPGRLQWWSRFSNLGKDHASRNPHRPISLLLSKQTGGKNHFHQTKMTF